MAAAGSVGSPSRLSRASSMESAARAVSEARNTTARLIADTLDGFRRFAMYEDGAASKAVRLSVGEDDYDTYLPLRLVFKKFEWLAHFRDFTAFISVLGLYILATSLRIDWWFGHTTLAWYFEAHEVAGVSGLDSRHTVSEAAMFLDTGLDLVTSTLQQKLCDDCLVGITASKSDVTRLSLSEFVCADFNSVENSIVYPPRDCAAADAAWSISPTALTAPCCTNSTLVGASIAMMAIAAASKGTISSAPLDTLVSGATEKAESSLDEIESFVTRQVTEKKFLIQVILSRASRMVGVVYDTKWVDHDSSPTQLTIFSRYWSQNFEAPWVGSLISGFYVMTAFCALLLFKKLPSLLVPLQPGLLAIELISILLPSGLELFKNYMPIATWIEWATITQLVLSLRLMNAATIAPPLEIFVRTFEHAGPQLMMFLIPRCPMLILTSNAHSQLFGVFDEGYSDPAIAMARVVQMLTAPPDAETGELYEHAGMGTQILYYWTTVLFRMSAGSFVVAILVGAFNAAQSIHGEMQRDKTLPKGMRALSKPPTLGAQLREIGEYLFTGRVCGVPGAAAMELMRGMIAGAERKYPDEGGAKDSQMLVPRFELASHELVGDEGASALLKRYGVARRGPPAPPPAKAPAPAPDEWTSLSSRTEMH